MFFAECLWLGISRVPFLPVVTAGLADALPGIAASLPDLALLHFPSDFSAVLALTREVTSSFAGTKVILLGVPDNDSAVLEYIEAGSSGWLAPSASLQEVMSLMIAVSKGEVICSPTLAYKMYGRLAELVAADKLREGIASSALTTREAEIVDLVAESSSNEEIAAQLHLSVHTVKKHVHNIMDKLRVGSRAELAAGIGDAEPGTAAVPQPPSSRGRGNGRVQLSAGAFGS